MKRTILALLLALALGLPAVTGATAQSTAMDQTLISELTGEEIDLGVDSGISFIEDNYDFRKAGNFSEEYVWFTYGWSNFQLVFIEGPNETVDYHDITLQNMEEFYDSWELIAEDTSEERSFFLGEGELDGQMILVYYEFELDVFGDVDLAFLQFTDISTFQGDLEHVQDEVTIGGEPLLSQVDASEVAALAGSETGTPDVAPEGDTDGVDTDRSRTTRGGTDDADTGETETDRSRSSRDGTDDSDADTDTEDDSTSRTSRTSRAGTDKTEADGDSTSRTSRTTRGGTDDDASNTSETRGDSRVGRVSETLRTGSTDVEDAESTPVPGADWDSMGLISDEEWESPSHGNVITWDRSTLEFPSDYEHAIVVNQDPPYDTLTLQTTDGLGYVFITTDLAYESTPANMVEFWVSDDYTSSVVGGVEILETGTTANSATMVYATTNTIDEPLIVVLEATFLDDGGVIFSQIAAAPETIQDVYAQFVEGVQLDGEPIEMTFTVEDIRDIAGN